MKTGLIYVIKAIENLQVKINEEEHSAIFAGTLRGEKIEVSLSLSVAPSVQSMLSRRGVVTCTAHVKIAGATAFFASDLEKSQMQEIGSYICDIQQKQTLKQEAEAYDKISHLI